MVSSSISLTDVSVQEVSIILENLGFFSLVDPFRRNAISGKSINRFDSYADIIDLDNVGIKKVVAQTFYEDYVQELKTNNAIPRDLLLQISPAISSLKVRKYACVYVWLLVRIDIHQ